MQQLLPAHQNPARVSPLPAHQNPVRASLFFSKPHKQHSLPAQQNPAKTLLLNLDI